MAITEPTNAEIWGDDLTTAPNIATPSGAEVKTGFFFNEDLGPLRAHMNWVLKRLSNFMEYSLQRGIPTWRNDRTYVVGSVVRDTIIWECIATPTVGEAPSAAPTKWVPWLPSGFGPFGDGSDGNGSVTGSTANTGDMNFNNLSIGASGSLRIRNGIVRVRGTLTIASGGEIRAGVATEMAGAIGSGGVGGTAGLGGNAASTGTVFGGASGGAGGATLASDGDDGVDVIDSRGGNAGAGGAGAATAAGAAGVKANALDFASTTTPQQIALAGGYGFARGGSASARTPTPFGIQGGPGGGGGGGGSAGGGGGGAGGGVMIVLARRVVIAADGAIKAPGGAGGPGLETAGAGGGGGGGVVMLVYGSKSGPALTAANCCPGGAAGTGGNASGSAGTQGYVIEMGMG